MTTPPQDHNPPIEQVLYRMALDDYIALPDKTAASVSRELGITKTGLLKMIRSKREMYVDVFKSGRVEWVELKYQHGPRRHQAINDGAHAGSAR